jgi:hypothetical protein
VTFVIAHLSKWRVALPLLAITGALMALGPAWPAEEAALICADGGTRAIHPDMTACVAAMDDACRECGIQERWDFPFVYLLGIPGLLVLASAVASRPIALAAASVWLVLAVVFAIPFLAFVYPPSVRMPLLVQEMVIVWPQLVFFGPTLYRSAPRANRLMSESSLYWGTIAFWVAASVAFGAVTAKRVSRWLLVPLAIAFVVAAVLLVRFGASLVGLRPLIETP